MTALVSANAKRVGRGGFGTLGSLIPAESFFFDDVDSPTSYFRGEITRFPSGKLFAFNDGTFAYEGEDSSFDYTVYKDGAAAGSYTVTLGTPPAGETFTSAIAAGIPIPSAAASIDYGSAATSAINAGIPVPTVMVQITAYSNITSQVTAGIPVPSAAAVLTLTQAGSVASFISAGIPKPIAAVAVSHQNAPVGLSVNSGIPRPTASVIMYTGEPSDYNWHNHIDEMIADGRFIVIADGSRFITFND